MQRNRNIPGQLMHATVTKNNFTADILFNSDGSFFDFIGDAPLNFTYKVENLLQSVDTAKAAGFMIIEH